MTLEPDNAVESAEQAGLRYVTDEGPGIQRKRAGEGFEYLGPDGCPIRDGRLVERIKSLAIPPAWEDVWICKDADGHLQATGRDARGRKQYRYHPRWREVRDASKYERLAQFAEALPRIREHVMHDLGQRGMPRTKVLATIVRLLEETSIRIGNDEYRRENQSFGLTTMLDQHAHIDGGTVRFEFKGKSGRQHSVKLSDRRLARIVKQCQDIPGQELFQYLDDDGQRHSVESSDVNNYLREVSGGDFTAKDFRTWNGTVLALRYLKLCESPTSATAGKRLVSGAIKSVAQDLGNTPAVCRKAYVHPVVLNAYLEGSLAPEAGIAEVKPTGELSEEEESVLGLLHCAAEQTAAA
ncbi:MAG: DNA topoisomerase IB [Chloroflexota bacterium]|nr:DNA topoisomerase IB [Chloroflexota bacterium]